MGGMTVTCSCHANNRATRRRVLRCIVLAAVSITLGFAPIPAHAVERNACRGFSATDLDGLFAGRVGDVVGGDYVRAYNLPTGNTLFIYQDAFVARNGREVTNLAKARFVHNAAVLVDSGGCVVRTVSGSRGFLGGSRTRPLRRWFWAMGGDVGADGRLHIMVVEMRNPNRTGAALGAVPVATWHAIVDPTSLALVSFRPAVNAGADLFGWSVTSDDAFTYLYAHCYRQFVPGTMLGHDPQCAGVVRVARVPKGQFDAQLAYFDGSGWVADPTVAAPLSFPGERVVNPVSVQYLGGQFVAASKEGDWWGSTIYIDTAPTAVGPWSTATTVVPAVQCEQCNTYFASLMPWRGPSGELVIGLSNNAWDMRKVAFPNPWIYRPSFLGVRINPQHRR